LNRKPFFRVNGLSREIDSAKETLETKLETKLGRFDYGRLRSTEPGGNNITSIYLPQKAKATQAKKLSYPNAEDCTMERRGSEGFPSKLPGSRNCSLTKLFKTPL
jgi:hypothetical protein